MTSLVSDFLITPVLRQARRFSAGLAPSPLPDSEEHAPPSVASAQRPSLENAVSEAGEDRDTSDQVSDTSTAGSGQAAFGPATGAAGTSPRTSILSGDTAASPSFLASSEHHHQIRSLAAMEHPMDAQPESAGESALLGAAAPFSPTTISTILGSGLLPEDDGMGPLRRKIIGIQEMDVSGDEKARLMHQLLSEGYTRSKSTSQLPSPRPEPTRSATVPAHPTLQGPLQALKFWTAGDSAELQGILLSDDDLRPTYAPDRKADDVSHNFSEDFAMLQVVESERRLGCEHYVRKVKLQCVTCEKWYTCRLCHDQAEDHVLPRHQTKHMLCMLCGCAQKASSSCTRCGESVARYYCNICKLWNDDPDKPMYHCNDCGICRVGQGIGKDFFHCKKCGADIAMSIEDSHRCYEMSAQSDCPICGDYMFTSRTSIVFMQCGHSIHSNCYSDLIKTSYKCPICSKSVVNMEALFRNLDVAVAAQPMPAAFNDTRANVFCNDCSAKSQTLYHWLGLKCSVCQSYNTKPLHVINLPNQETLARLSSALPDDLAADTPIEAVVAPGLATFASPEAMAARGLSWPRRPSTHRPGASIGSHGDMPSLSPFLVPDRQARSVSPDRVPGFAGSFAGGGPADYDSDESDREDILDFWNRAARTMQMVPEHDDENDEVDDEGDSDSEDDEENEDEEEEEEEEDANEMSLLGHR